MSNTLVDRINQKLDAINTRAAEITSIGNENKQAVAQLAPRLQAITTRLTALREAIQGIAQAKADLENTIQGLDPRLEAVQTALQQGVDRINLEALDAELNRLDQELTALESAIQTATMPSVPPGNPTYAQAASQGGPPQTGGYIIPKLKLRSAARKSASRKSAPRKSAPRKSTVRKSAMGYRLKGGKKTKKMGMKKH